VIYDFFQITHFKHTLIQIFVQIHKLVSFIYYLLAMIITLTRNSQWHNENPLRTRFILMHRIKKVQS